MRIAFAAAAATVCAGAFGAPQELLDTKREVTLKPGECRPYEIRLKPEWGVLTVEGAIKTDGLVPGRLPWMNGRVPMSFHDAKGKQVGGWPDVFGFSGTRDWTECRRDYKVPRGAASLKIGLYNFGTEGTASYSPFRVTKKRDRVEKPANAPLPDGVKGDPWTIGDAWSAKTEKRGRWCLNGLWGLRPVLGSDSPDRVPGADDCWGWGKIPAVLASHTRPDPNGQTPVVSDYFADNGVDVEFKDRAWYRRDFTMPEFGEGQKVALTFTMLHTRAEVFVDGKKAATVRYPGGEADITEFAKPGAKQSVALYVTAYPLDPKTLDFNAPDRSELKESKLKFKGVTGDVYLDVFPAAARIKDATVECKTGPNRVKFVAECEGLEANAKYILKATLKGCGTEKTFVSGAVAPDAAGKVSFETAWPEAKTWDVHTPGNLYSCSLELCGAAGETVDAAIPFRFGFREIRCEGRDLKLNGKTIHLRALYNANMNRAAGTVCKETCLETCRRLKSEGFNFIIAGNYNYSPGEISYMDGLLEACDETGMLFSYSLPHMRDFKMRLDEPKVETEYAKLTEWAVKRARNHPSVITYALNHNATGYVGDMNPLKIDGVYDLGAKTKEGLPEWHLRSRGMARKTARIARGFDATRPIYHHESGNLDDFHTVNIYLNWSPVQERSDWLEHWSANGVKPLFFVEWGMPHISSWSSYRGPLFIWRHQGYQSLWAAEYAASLLGDAAYEGDSPATVNALKMEERLWARAESVPFYWSQMLGGLRAMTNLYQGVQSAFMEDNLKSHRAWGISAFLPWDQEAFWDQRRGCAARENPRRWEGLKNPGIVPDGFAGGRFDMGEGEAGDFVHSPVGRTMLRWNMPDCAFIGGDGVFTDKRHHYAPGGEVRKTLVILNDRRERQTVKWRCAMVSGGKTLGELSGAAEVEAGCRFDAPVKFALPGKPGKFRLEAKFEFEGGVVQTDAFGLESHAEAKVAAPAKFHLYDPEGLTAKEFARLGVKHARVAEMGAYGAGDSIAVGRGALTKEVLEKAVAAARKGAHVLVFEQTKEALESVGFRVQNHGLRNLFPRWRGDGMPELTETELRDWNGSSTLLPTHLEGIPENETRYSTETWAGFRNTRVWRCGNRGTVASVIPEKPTWGDWRALADGGFDLQYAPLLDWVVELGRITFCQLDVTARTEADPVADNVVRALVSRMTGKPAWPKWPRALGRRAWIAGRDLGVGIKENLQDRDNGWFIVSSGAKKPEGFADYVAKGGRVLCLGLTAKEVAEWSPVKLAMAATNGCYAARIEKPPYELRGLSNADWQWHGAMDFDAFTEKSEEGNAAIRVVRHGKGSIVFWQVPPWKFDVDAKPYLRTSRRRADWMLSRLIGNMGCVSYIGTVKYRDVPVAEDDPYRYYRW